MQRRYGNVVNRQMRLTQKNEYNFLFNPTFFRVGFFARLHCILLRNGSGKEKKICLSGGDTAYYLIILAKSGHIWYNSLNYTGILRVDNRTGVRYTVKSSKMLLMSSF